ncbi:hypothetical protein HOK31_15535 [Candidatus Poribacteria bacterium]|nr:hypothetical protein [Candidatus Poribacteria bacterium]
MIATLSACIAIVAARAVPVVEVEDTVATYAPANNGAGPLWCYGAPLIARVGDRVYASALETGVDVEPLCNTRWRLFAREDDGAWELIGHATEFDTREPCPLGATQDGRVFLSINPLIDLSGRRSGPSDPQLLEFTSPAPGAEPQALDVPWAGGHTFTEHSYRGFAVDGEAGEQLAMNIDSPTGDQFWAHRDAGGNWTNAGRVPFPIRSCYPQVSLRHGGGHVLAIRDIVEPVDERREYKFEQTQRKWDYVFRRLFYAWTPDISSEQFGDAIEIDDVDATSGHISNLDMFIADDGAAHILYLRRTVQSTSMRDRFFPDERIAADLVHVVLRDGIEASRQTLIAGGEGTSGLQPAYGRFHRDADGGLHVVYAASGTNGLIALTDDGPGEPVTIPLEEPFGTFFTATERGGSPPSDTLDLFGIGREGQVLRYARVQLP